MRMVGTNHRTEQGDPYGGVRENNEGAEGVCNPIGRRISTNQTPQCSQGLNHQPMSTDGETHDSSHIGSRGWHCRVSTGGKALGPVKGHYPNVGECQGIEVGVGGWVVVGASS